MKLNQQLAIYGMAAALCVGTLAAQDVKTDNNDSGRRPRGNFDPAQFQQRMLENIKNQLAFTNEADWTAVQPLVQKVLEARQEVMSQSMGLNRLGRRPSNSEGGSSQGGENRANSAFKSNPEAEYLQNMLDDKVPAAAIKSALEKYRAMRKDKEAKLTAAQENLRKVLTVRQEAQAALLGLVP